MRPTAGAAIGATAGPVGTGVGLAAGAVVGGLVGKAGGEAANPTISPDLGRFIDYTVVDRDNNNIGSVDAVWQEGTGQPMFLAVRTGWLGIGKAHVVPAQAADVSERSKKIRLPFTSEQIKQAPSFECTADLDRDSIDRIGAYYQPYGYKRDRDIPKQRIQGKEEARVQLKEEELKVGKREVEYGGIRLHKVVRTETVNQPVQLKREEIVIQRVPTAETARTQACDADFSEQDVYIPLRREEPVVAKEARVREEVRVGKKSEREERTISETVRKEDVEIEEQRTDQSRLTPTGERAKTQKYEPKERGRS